MQHEWSNRFLTASLSNGVQDIVNDSKSAQMENRDSFLAIGQKRLDRWDLRLPKGKAQELDAPTVLGWEAGNAFKDGDFTCIATSGTYCPRLLHVVNPPAPPPPSPETPLASFDRLASYQTRSKRNQEV